MKTTDTSKIPFFHNFIATGFGSGYSPVAPGTAGALVATLIWWGYSAALNDYISIISITAILVIVFTVLGVWSSGVSEKYWGEDPSRVVVDEMVGTWIHDCRIRAVPFLRYTEAVGHPQDGKTAWRLRHYGRRYPVGHLRNDCYFHFQTISLSIHNGEQVTDFNNSR